MHINTSFKPDFESTEVTTGHIPISQAAMSSYTGDMVASSADSYQYPSAYTAHPTWEYDNLSSSTDASWLGGYDSTLTTTATTATTTTTTTWAPSVDPYTAYPTTSQAASAAFYPNNGSFFPSYPFSNPATLSSSDWTRPSLTRSASADNTTNLTAYGSNPPSRLPSTAPVTPIEYQLSTSDMKTKPASPRASSTKSKTFKSAPKKRESSVKPKKESAKRKALQPQPGPQITPTPIPTTQEALDDYLLSRFGLPLPENARHLSSEQIRHEAWKVCESQAKEMSERRMKLLEHEGGALERETKRLQMNVGLLRESILQEQRQLEKALEIAERLSSEY